MEFIQLARPTLSLSKDLQQVGRGLRIHPDKVRTVILDEAGLYRSFGLPTAPIDWQQLFSGRLAGKGEVYKDTEPEESERECNPSDNDMEIILEHGQFLRDAANRRAEVEPFEQNGKYGLRKGDDILFPPTYMHIAPFVGQYAVFTHPNKEYGIITVKGNVLPLPKCRKIELLADKFAYIEETPIVRCYLDLKTFERYTYLPKVFRLHLLEFVIRNDGLYYLRIQAVSYRIIPAFRKQDLRFDGEDFFHNGILIRRSEPDKIYWQEGCDENGYILISDRNRRVYRYQKEKVPVYYGEKVYHYNTYEVVKK